MKTLGNFLIVFLTLILFIQTTFGDIIIPDLDESNPPQSSFILCSDTELTIIKKQITSHGLANILIEVEKEATLLSVKFPTKYSEFNDEQKMLNLVWGIQKVKCSK